MQEKKKKNTSVVIDSVGDVATVIVVGVFMTRIVSEVMTRVVSEVISI